MKSHWPLNLVFFLYYYFALFHNGWIYIRLSAILGDLGADSGARESLNGGKKMAWRSKERQEEPLGTMSYQTSSKRSPPFWLLIGARKLLCFSAQSEGRTAATVWNWSGKTLSPGALLAVLYFFMPYFFPRLDFPSPPLSAPGSPRMTQCLFFFFFSLIFSQTRPVTPQNTIWILCLRLNGNVIRTIL